MFRIYTKEIIAKEKFTINLTQEEIDLVLEGDYFKDHKDLEATAHCIVEQDYPFEYPTYDAQKDTIREMTLYERYDNGLYALSEREKEYQGSIITLEPGQYIDENGVLQNIPKIKGVNVEWDWKTHKWEEKATFEEIIEERKNKILKYSELEKEKRALEGSKFSSENEILSVSKEMTQLEKEIDLLANIILTLK